MQLQTIKSIKCKKESIMYKKHKLKWDMCAMNAAVVVRFEHPVCYSMLLNQLAQSL